MSATFDSLCARGPHLRKELRLAFFLAFSGNVLWPVTVASTTNPSFGGSESSRKVDLGGDVTVDQALEMMKRAVEALAVDKARQAINKPMPGAFLAYIENWPLRVSFDVSKKVVYLTERGCAAWVFLVPPGEGPSRRKLGQKHVQFPAPEVEADRPLEVRAS